jgi:hypothetical protein
MSSEHTRNDEEHTTDLQESTHSIRAMQYINMVPCDSPSHNHLSSDATGEQELYEFCGLVRVDLDRDITPDVKERLISVASSIGARTGEGCTLVRLPSTAMLQGTAAQLEDNLCECVESAKSFMQISGLSAALLIAEQQRGMHRATDHFVLVTGSSLKSDSFLNSWNTALQDSSDSREVCDTLVQLSKSHVLESFTARRSLVTSILNACCEIPSPDQRFDDKIVRRLVVSDACHTACHSCVSPSSVVLSNGAYSAKHNGAARCVAVGNLKTHGVDIVDVQSSRLIQSAMPPRHSDMEGSNIDQRVKRLMQHKQTRKTQRNATSNGVVWSNRHHTVNLHNLEHDNDLVADAHVHAHLNVMCAAVPLPEYEDCISLVAAELQKGVELTLPASKATLDLLMKVEGKLSVEAAQAWATQEQRPNQAARVILPREISDKLQDAVQAKYLPQLK